MFCCLKMLPYFCLQCILLGKITVKTALARLHY